MARARAYILGTIPSDVVFRGQAKLCIAQLSKEEAQAKTVKEIAEAITNTKQPIELRLVTRQDPIRVVSFYMSVWNKKKWVVPVTVERDEAEAAATEAAENESFNTEDDGTDATPEERIEAANEAEVTATHEEQPPALNLDGLKVGEAVLAVLGQSASPATSDHIAAFLNGRGYEVRTKQVQSALSNLVGKGAVKRNEDGAYARA